MNKEREQEAFIKLENSNLDELKRIIAVLKTRGYEAEGDIDLSDLTFMYSQNMVKYKANELNNEFSHKYTLKQVKELKDMFSFLLFKKNPELLTAEELKTVEEYTYLNMCQFDKLQEAVRTGTITKIYFIERNEE